MIQKKSLSIIIPHYNSPRLLEVLLNSILPLEEIQVIVVDDRSNQDLLEYQRVRSKYEKQGVEFYTNDRSKSAGSCRNIGLCHAKGDWLLFADSDDYFLEGFYAIVSEYFDSEYDMVFFSPKSVVLSTGQPSDRHVGLEKMICSYIDNPNIQNELILRYKYSCPWSKMIRYKIVEERKIDFDEIVVSNDAMFSAKCGYGAERIFADARNIYCVTMSKGSLINCSSEEIFDIRTDVFFRKYKYLKEKLSTEDMKLLDINGRIRIFQVIQNGYGIKKALGLLREYKRYGIQFWNWDLIPRAFHYIYVIFEQMYIKNRDRKFIEDKLKG